MKREQKHHPSHSAADPWSVEDWAFPYEGPVAAQWDYLLRYAMLAPSTRNTQPWRFEITGNTLALYADRSRAVKVADPGARELIMSCGAALFHIRVAMRHYGFDPLVTLLPNPVRSDLMAHVEMGPRLDVRDAPTAEDERLFRAMKQRRTHRLPFSSRPVRDDVVEVLRTAARVEGCRLHVVDAPVVARQLGALVAQGKASLYAHPNYWREYAAWYLSPFGGRADGIPHYAQTGEDGREEPGFLGRALDALFNRAQVRAARTGVLAERAPLLVVLSTPADGIAAHLAAGQALDRLLLTGAAYGLQASFLNQALVVPPLRAQAAVLVGAAYPQIMLRMGYGATVRPTPRRSVHDVATWLSSVSPDPPDGMSATPQAGG